MTDLDRNLYPKPTNRDAKRLLEKMINRLSLAPVRTCRLDMGLTCVLCGGHILPGDEYRDRGFAARAHVTCQEAIAGSLR